MSKILKLFTISFIILSFGFFKIDIVFADPSNNYYIANDGDDLNDGLSPLSPWKTIAKVNSELNGGVINTGDDIYFKRGDVFTGELVIRVGGSSSDYMVIGAYDSEFEAIQKTSEQYELGTFLVQKCEPGSESYTQSYNSRVMFA